MPDPVVTYDDPDTAYDSIGITFDGSDAPVIKISKKRHKRMEDYLGVGNALVHR